MHILSLHEIPGTTKQCARFQVYFDVLQNGAITHLIAVNTLGPRNRVLYEVKK